MNDCEGLASVPHNGAKEKEKRRKLRKSGHKLTTNNKHLQSATLFFKKPTDPEDTRRSKLSICPRLPKP